ncbi:dnaJ homolog subfamily C member 17 [Nomia melanderi]|uniref:dnaJ homolog subfamily C member 17 n=1 Tax=Nomia melanderi TaxID=2448451 RepID=UPI00130406A9|nr:dnaJ homolog subfamily C member 17 [Nomia melanderi]
MDHLIDRDLYEFIGTTNSATTQEIKKAYRKKALSCHPDKNPNNPRAAELFHELSRALEILTDASARAAYDKVINAKHQAKLRAREFDAKRKKLKEDLEAREDAYKQSLYPKSSRNNDEDKLRAEIERLRKEGSKQVEEEVAFMKKKIEEESKKLWTAADNDSGSYKIKIKWKTNKNNLNNTYDYNTLFRIFSKYGDVVTLILSSTKDGRALVEYQNRNDAEMALNTEIGLTQNPLKLSKLWDSPTRSNVKEEKSSHTVNLNECTSNIINDMTKNKVSQSEMSDAEFERVVLNNLRRAEEEKRHSNMSSSKKGT